jgi:subtilisin-like proprotein convertase family protein
MAYFENTTPVAIPDNDSAGAYSDIAVTTADYVTGFEVSATVTHTYIGDITLVLVSPAGYRYVLRDQDGGSASGTFVFEFTPTELIGIGAAGTWRLQAIDNWDGDVGTLDQWSITLSSTDGLYSRLDDAVGDFVSPPVVTGTLTATASCAADFTGTVPAVGQIEATASATMIATGLAGIDLISTARPRELYRCYIDSDLHGTTEIPIASAVVRQNAGGTGYLQVSMPNYARVGDIIQRAADGKLRIDYVLEKEGREQATPFAQTDAIRVTQEQGARSRSVVITGSFTLASESPKTLELQGASYISDSGDTKRIRCQHNPRVSVGDTIYSNEMPTGLVQSTVLTISSLGKQFEVTVQ